MLAAIVARQCRQGWMSYGIPALNVSCLDGELAPVYCLSPQPRFPSLSCQNESKICARPNRQPCRWKPFPMRHPFT